MAVSLDDLLDHVGLVHEDLKTRCTGEDLMEISLFISNWEKYADFLRLTQADIEDIAAKNTTESQRNRLALQRWKQMFAFRATFEFLVKEVFLKNNDAEVALKVCEHLKSAYVTSYNSMYTCRARPLSEMLRTILIFKPHPESESRPVSCTID